MRYSHSISVIIPCFNDGYLIKPVVTKLIQSRYTKEIIVVDDGSDQETKKQLSQLSKIKLITHTYNQGKSQSLKTGVLNASGKFIAFIDSDLIGFKTSHFDQLVKPVLKDKYDITLSFRKKEAWYGIITGIAIAWTGERCLKTSLIKANLDIFNQKGYLVESIFNQKFFGKVRIAAIPLSGLGQLSQPQKNGLKGWYLNFKQIFNVINHIGIWEFLRKIAYVKKPGFVVS